MTGPDTYAAFETAAAVDGDPELDVVKDLLRRSLPIVLPGATLLGALAAGVDGAVSAALGVVLVAANLVLAAVSLAWAARISLGMLMGVSLFGYVLRLGLLFLVVLLLRDLEWIHLATLGVTIVVTHLGALGWELRYVSASLAFPGLKPPPPTTATKERLR